MPPARTRPNSRDRGIARTSATWHPGCLPAAIHLPDRRIAMLDKIRRLSDTAQSLIVTGTLALVAFALAFLVDHFG
jgi:hypothetical protein